MLDSVQCLQQITRDGEGLYLQGKHPYILYLSSTPNNRIVFTSRVNIKFVDIWNISLPQVDLMASLLKTICNSMMIDDLDHNVVTVSHCILPYFNVHFEPLI